MRSGRTAITNMDICFRSQIDLSLRYRRRGNLRHFYDKIRIILHERGLKPRQFEFDTTREEVMLEKNKLVCLLIKCCFVLS